MSVLGVALVILALPLPWFPSQQQGFEVVLWLTLGGRSGGGWIGVGTMIAALLSHVSALCQPGLPKPTWVHTRCLFVTIVVMGLQPFPQDPFAFGYWMALAGVVVIWLGSLVRNLTALRAQRKEPVSTTPQEAARRRARKSLGWGFLVGFLPPGLALVLLPTLPQFLAMEFVMVVGLYGVAWKGVGLLWMLRPTPSHSAIALGLLIALLVSGGLGLCSWIGMLAVQGLVSQEVQLPTPFQRGGSCGIMEETGAKTGPIPTSPACCW